MRRIVLAALFVACEPYAAAESPAAPAPAPDAATEAGAPAGAVYVAPDGRDFAEGTKDAPVATFKRALELATASGAATVYACAASYDENVLVDRPIAIVGDRSCRTWAPSSARARIAPYAGVALRIAKTSRVTIEAMEIAGAADHTVPGSSAVAVLVSASSDVVLRRVEVRAGFGIGGADGVERTNYAAPIANVGGDATLVPGTGPTCACTDMTTSTGGTGAGASPATSGSASPALGSANAGASGTTCTPGGAGADAPPAVAASGAIAPLVIDAERVAITFGGDGKSGAPAQGGGGGGATMAASSAGGGGGCGGCGGAGGGGGTSGGSSIAIATIASSVLVEDGTLVAANGAPGGAGASGQVGQLGGAGGAGSSACAGGPGGRGGSGGAGGGGAGGHSVTIAHVGPAPELRGVTTTFGRAGAPGAGGAPNGGAGASGQAKAVLAL